nr:MAG TPA: Tail tube [Caudoviricetes sp.]
MKVAGTCYINVDGTQLVVNGAVTVPITKVTRETIKAGYFSEVERTPYVALDAVIDRDFPIEQIANGTDMTVTAELANGKTYVLSGAYLVEEPEYSADDGTASLRFEGSEGRWD